MQFFSTFSPIVSPYRAVILDLWGCVHDGTALYPGARECLEALRKTGKKVLFLSNAPRRNAKVVAVLEQLGVTADLYDGVLSSGEAGWRMLRGDWGLGIGDWNHFPNAQSPIPNPYFFIGPLRDADVLDGLNLRAAPLEQAEFILNVGFGSEAQAVSEWHAPLRAARARELPMLCLNPDMEVVKLTGERFPCAGVIAKEYEALGGQVTYIGKPHPLVYEMALEMLGCGREEVIAVGDGLHTDILGAKRAGIASVLVTGGILKAELGEVDEARVMKWLSRQDVQPDYMMPGLVW